MLLQMVFAQNLVSEVYSLLLKVLLASSLSVFGYILGLLVESIFSRLFTSLQFEKLFKRYSIERAFLGIHIRDLIGGILRWWVFFGFLAQAVIMFDLPHIAMMAESFYTLYVNLAIGILYLAVGSTVATYVGNRIRRMEVPGRELTVRGIQAIILYFSIVTALPYFGVENVGILTRAVEIFLWALAAAFGLGLGLAIGLGAQDAVREIVNKRKGLIEEIFVGKK